MALLPLLSTIMVLKRNAAQRLDPKTRTKKNVFHQTEMEPHELNEAQLESLFGKINLL